MPTIEGWVAGAFDVSGHVFPRQAGGLGVRIFLPHRALAQQIRNVLGGSVGGIDPARWTISDPEDLEEFLHKVGPFVRGQKGPIQWLHQWVDEEITTDQAEGALNIFYRRYKPLKRREKNHATV